MSTPHGWIGVDLDGTLAHYDKWRGENHIGDPIPEMVARIKAWIAKGQEVRIMTARVGVAEFDTERHERSRRKLVQDWLEHAAGLPRLEVTCVKDYQMVELWDDRAVSVVPNTGKSERQLWLDPEEAPSQFEEVAPEVFNPRRLSLLGMS